MEFNVIKQAVAQRFKEMSAGKLYVTGVSKDELWDTYLNSFPEGTNPIYRERTDHDCHCCRQFIRAVGNVVAIADDGSLVSIWDVAMSSEPAYQVVADAMSALVKSTPISDVFLHFEKTAGTDKNFEEVVGGNPVVWTHFFVNIPQTFVVKNIEIGTKLGEQRALHDVLARGLKELTLDAVDTVLELIGQNSLYRGEEYKKSVESFRKLKVTYDAIMASKPANAREAKADNFAWQSIYTVPASVLKIRNTAIGTLLIDLSAGVELEAAVRKFETSIMCPTNYKRPTALVTPAMVEKAKVKVEELGLTSALSRRTARLTDISVNDILFADRTARKNLSGNVFDDVVATVSDKKPKNMDKIEEISIEKFIKDVLPQATSLEIMLENQHIKNLVSLVAPVDPTAGRLFKWNNNFSLTYNGDVTDSIKEKVKAAGGNVTGDLCCRLAWSNFDDLDLHMQEPNDHIYYATHTLRNRSKSKSGGQLDVDMNAGEGKTREPVENIFYASKSTMKEGVYKLYVNQFSKRESVDVGFELELDFMGEVFHFAYDKAVTGNVVVAEFSYSHAEGIKFIKSLPSTTATKEVWGLTTNKYHKVNLMMYSPNHWESTGTGVGNKHYVFMLDGCVNPEPARGFFNEYLDGRLDEHRKVFELVGSKTKTEVTEDQLAGVGFSSTNRASVLCKVAGSFNRIVKVMF